MLMLAYHYMPKGSLDARIFCPSEKAALGWNLRYKILFDVSLTKPMPKNLTKDNKLGIILALGIGLLAALVILGVGWWGVAMHRRQVAANDPNILGALKSLHGTPREFSFKELKKATNNFDDKQWLGEGGFGVVGLVSLLKFSRQRRLFSGMVSKSWQMHFHLKRVCGECPNPSKIRASSNLAMGQGGLKRAGFPILLSSVS
ncbi:hypothetical protein CRG98_047507 [Punica granatum]|uniref:Protein kinase domain-containing protein n=1 Tax=Punica granatum TaxID=22663 RepID=A0A2I0HKI6_PUNGR|nr:hypothetical protein CRG98_047507 [Punica granatum]